MCKKLKVLGNAAALDKYSCLKTALNLVRAIDLLKHILIAETRFLKKKVINQCQNLD